MRLLRDVVAPAAVWAVVKADGYGHGAPRSPPRRLRPAPPACAWRSRRRASSCDGPASRRRSWCSANSHPSSSARCSPHGLTPPRTRPRTSTPSPPRSHRRGGELPRARQGRHRACNASGAQPVDAAALVAHVRALEPQVSRGRVFTHLACADDPDVAGQRGAARSRSTRCSPSSTTVGCGRRRARRQLGRCARPSGESLRPGARRNRDLRHLARARRRPPRRAICAR